jgi:divinyl protochlorophyllide a 8-vinyl-reductase
MSHTITSNTERRPNAAHDAADRAGRIGPNAVTQLVESLRAAGLERAMAPAFSSVGAAVWLAAPPEAMVDAAQVGRLHRAVRASLPPAQATALMADAGRRTADYLLSARIPRPVQRLLKLLPARLSAMLLVSAIRAHAWTFAGAGRFSARAGSPTIFELSGNPLCAGEHSPTPVCAWHEAVFRRLFQALVSPAATAVETSCAACGDAHCRFVLGWRATDARPHATPRP